MTPDEAITAIPGDADVHLGQACVPQVRLIQTKTAITAIQEMFMFILVRASCPQVRLIKQSIFCLWCDSNEP